MRLRRMPSARWFQRYLEHLRSPLISRVLPESLWGGRTGITAIAAGVLFLSALFFTPLIGLVPAFATAPALILVGALLMSEVGKINFTDFTDALPAFLTIIMMPLTSSIANGFAFGFISYTIMKIVSGQYKKVSWIMYLVSAAFLINLALRS